MQIVGINHISLPLGKPADRSRNPNSGKLFRIRFDPPPQSIFTGTYAGNPEASGATNTGADTGLLVRAKYTFQTAGLYSLNSAGQLVSAVDGKLGGLLHRLHRCNMLTGEAYLSQDASGTTVFDTAPTADAPALASCQIDGSNVLTCVKTLNPPATSATYVCNTALSYGYCRQGAGEGGPMVVTTAVFV